MTEKLADRSFGRSEGSAQNLELPLLSNVRFNLAVECSPFAAFRSSLARPHMYRSGANETFPEILGGSRKHLKVVILKPDSGQQRAILVRHPYHSLSVFTRR